MRFSVIITLGLNFILLFYRVVSSSQYSVLRNQILSIDEGENALGKFFTEFSNVYLRRIDPQQVIIIGGSNDQLQQAKPLIESYPHVIFTDMGNCVYRKDFYSRGFFVVFLDDLVGNTLENNHQFLSGCKKGCEILFVLEKISIQSNDIRSFFERISNRHMINSALAHLVEDEVKIYGAHFAENCTMGIKLIWKSEADMNEIKSFGEELRNMKGCPVSVGSFQYMPKMVIEEKNNGSLKIVGGQDGRLVLLMAEKLNFTVNLKYPTMADSKDSSKKSAILKEVNSGIVHFGVSRMRPTNQSAISLSFDEECITWAVPRRIRGVKTFLRKEFSWESWLLITLILVISCVIGYIYQNIIQTRNSNQRGVHISKIILEVLSMSLGNPATRQPISITGKMMMIAFIYYSMVITTAYKASLDAILTTVKSSSTVTDSRGIVTANMEVGGSLYHYQVLKDQADGSEISSKLLERYTVYANDSKAAERVKFDRNFAFLARRSTLYYEKEETVRNHDLLTFDVLDKCVLTYPTVLVFPQGSFLLEPINEVIAHLTESGILDYWDRIGMMSDKELESQDATRFAAVYQGQKFNRIFLLYGICICSCIVVFFIELLTAKLKPKNKPRIAQLRNYRTK